jgi:hypothetical protein
MNPLLEAYQKEAVSIADAHLRIADLPAVAELVEALSECLVYIECSRAAQGIDPALRAAQIDRKIDMVRRNVARVGVDCGGAQIAEVDLVKVRSLLSITSHLQRAQDTLSTCLARDRVHNEMLVKLCKLKTHCASQLSPDTGVFLASEVLSSFSEMNALLVSIDDLRL